MFPHLQRHTYWELVGAAILKTWLHVQKLLQNVVENVFYGGDRPSGFVFFETEGRGTMSRDSTQCSILDVTTPEKTCFTLKLLHKFC